MCRSLVLTGEAPASYSTDTERLVRGDSPWVGRKAWEGRVTKDEFLTARWNNLLSLGLGLPTVAYVVFALSTTLWSQRAGFIGLVVIGVLY